MAIQPALLLIADIGGYTRFMNVNRVNLAHAQEVVADLLEAVIEGASRRWKLAKLEGDAAFFYSVLPDREAVDRDIVREAARIRGAFMKRQAELTMDSACACEGCSQAGNLKLKFAAHRGDIAFQKVKRYRELAGMDVILVHRMLKNSVPLPEYVLMTEPLAKHVGDDFRPKLQSVEDEFEGIGRMTTHYLDLAEILPEPYDCRPSWFRRFLHNCKFVAGTLPYLMRLKTPMCEGFRNLNPQTGGVLPAPAEPRRALTG